MARRTGIIMIKMRGKALYLLGLVAMMGTASAEATTPIRLSVLSNGKGPVARHAVPLERIRQQLLASFDSEGNRELRARVILDSRGEPDHVVVFRLVQGFHKVLVSNVRLDRDSRFLSRTDSYRLQPADRLPAVRAQCPDASVEFIAFAPNNDDLEQQVTEEVARAAEAAGLKTVRLTHAQATRMSYLNYMTCPRLKGNFYDGDADPYLIVTADSEITSDEISTVLNGAFRRHVTNIWLACEAYNNPILTSAKTVAKSQKYAAGINDLQVGPSDRAAACAMEAAFLGQAMTQAFDECYRKLDSSADQWGFGGDGSDYFGQ